MLHQLFRFDWKTWRALSPADQQRIAANAVAKLNALTDPGEKGPRTALYSLLGHKGDLMLIHLRDNFESLNQIELTLAQTELYDYLTQTHSYVSVVELGLYESTATT